jgi:hypothetical protein
MNFTLKDPSTLATQNAATRAQLTMGERIDLLWRRYDTLKESNCQRALRALLRIDPFAYKARRAILDHEESILLKLHKRREREYWRLVQDEV